MSKNDIGDIGIYTQSINRYHPRIRNISNYFAKQSCCQDIVEYIHTGEKTGEPLGSTIENTQETIPLVNHPRT